jgi:hypothetical protein
MAFAAMRHEHVIARMSQSVEACRADYLRIKQAGNEVTAGDLAAAIGAYKEALENLSEALHAPPYPDDSQIS